MSETPELKKKFDLPMRPRPGEAKITKVRVRKVKRDGETRVMVARRMATTQREKRDKDRSRTPPRAREDEEEEQEHKEQKRGHTALWTATFCFDSFVEKRLGSISRNRTFWEAR